MDKCSNSGARKRRNTPSPSGKVTWVTSPPGAPKTVEYEHVPCHLQPFQWKAQERSRNTAGTPDGGRWQSLTWKLSITLSLRGRRALAAGPGDRSSGLAAVQSEAPLVGDGCFFPLLRDPAPLMAVTLCHLLVRSSRIPEVLPAQSACGLGARLGPGETLSSVTHGAQCVGAGSLALALLSLTHRENPRLGRHGVHRRRPGVVHPSLPS